MLVWMTHLGGHRRASASLLGAFFIMTTVLVVTFTIQVSNLYIIQLKVQRTADLATLAAAVGATVPVVSAAGVANASATETALNVASLNGFGASTVSTTGALFGGTPTLTTTISNTPTPIMGAWMGGASPVVAVPARALMTPVVVSDCIATLGGSFQISGTATVSAPGCGVASQSTISMSGGSFTAGAAAVSVHAYDEIPLITGGTPSPGTGAFMYNAVTFDTAAANASIPALQAHLASLATWPYGSTIPKTATAQSVPAGTAQTFSGQTVSVPANTHWGALTLLTTGTTLNFAGSGGADNNCATPTTISGATQLNGSNTLNFDSGCYIFNGSVSTDYGGSGSVTNFNINAGATVVFRFQGTINIYVANGGSLNFGNAYSYSFIGDINQFNFSAYDTGSFTVGTGIKIFSGNISNFSGHIKFGNGASYLSGTTISSGNNSGNDITFGNGTFYLWNGLINNIQNGGTSFGTGPYYFYNTRIVNATYGQGSVNFAGGDYYFYGGSITSGQNYFANMNFYIGNMDLYAGTTITVNSTMRLGNASASSGSATVSLYGGSLTVNGGQLVLWGSTVGMTTGAFTISGGSVHSAPPSNTTPNYGYTNLALLSTGGNIDITSNSSYFGGIIYAPDSTVTISGGAILQSYSNPYCFSLVARTVTLSGSSSTSMLPCTGLSATSTGINSRLNQ